MENLSTTSMPKPFDNEPDLNNSLSSDFELHEDERQGEKFNEKEFVKIFRFFLRIAQSSRRNRDASSSSRC